MERLCFDDNVENVIIYLGSKCNANCPYCHREIEPDLPINENLINELKKKSYNVSFKGGEPLVYFSTIKKFVTECKNCKFTITTNGLLLEKYKDFLLNNNITIILSNDGNPIRHINLRSSCKITGTSSVILHGYTDIEENIDNLNIDSLFLNVNLNYAPHLLHSTSSKNDIFALSKNDYDNVLKQYKKLLYRFIYDYKSYGIINNRYYYLCFSVLRYLNNNFEYGETRCCNKKTIRINTLGDEFTCLYIRDTKLDYNWQTTQQLIIEKLSLKCKNCNVYNICGAGCIKSQKHELECYFYKNFYNWLIIFEKNNRDILMEIKNAYKR